MRPLRLLQTHPNLFDIADEKHQTKQNIKHCHKWDDDLGYICNTLDTTDQHKCHADTQIKDAITTVHEYVPIPGISTLHDSFDQRIPQQPMQYHSPVRMFRYRTILHRYRRMQRSSQAISLCTHTFFDIVEWSTECMIVFIYHTILNCKESSAYLVAIPKNAASTIQNRAPGHRLRLLLRHRRYFRFRLLLKAPYRVHRTKLLLLHPLPHFFTIHFRASGSLRTAAHPYGW